MIKSLSIRNLLLIDKIDFIFNSGLCVLTGETGAGKSMIIDSLNLISGSRIKTGLKPEKGKITSITAVLEIIKNPKIKKLLLELGIECEDEIIIRRTINDDGKSKSFINDNLISLSILKEVSSNLLEIHSQFSEQGLLDSTTHIKTLDAFGKYQKDLTKLRDLWELFTEKKKEFMKLKKNYENNDYQKELLENYLNELKILNPKENEFEELNKKKTILKNSVKISENINNIIKNFNSDDPPGIEKQLSQNIIILNKIRDLLDDDSKKMINNLDSLSLEISEISDYFCNLISDEFDIKTLDAVEERIELYKKIAKKHGVNENSLINLDEELNEKMQSSFDIEEKINTYEKEVLNLENNFNICAKNVSTFRKEFAAKLDESINKELPALKLENAVFKTFIEEDKANIMGIDKVLFKIKTNPKSEMDSIKNVSSGGELCRIALAIKVIAEKENNTIMVFDEVDSGIGGAVSSAVGERLRKLGSNKQVLVVTHSPQVAAFGQDHFIVKKINSENTTNIFIRKLNLDEKINEIARMLSGKKITDEAISAAKKLIHN